VPVLENVLMNIFSCPSLPSDRDEHPPVAHPCASDCVELPAFRHYRNGGRPRGGELIVASARINWRRIRQSSSTPKPPGASNQIITVFIPILPIPPGRFFYVIGRSIPVLYAGAGHLPSCYIKKAGDLRACGTLRGLPHPHFRIGCPPHCGR